MYSDDLINLLKSKQNVYWDWNGTLINDVDVCIDITNDFLETKGIATISKDFYLKNFTIPVKDYYERLKIRQHGVTFEEITDSFVKGYNRHRMNQPLYEGAKEVLAEIGESSTRQIILSAAHKDELEFQAKHHEIEKHLDHMSGAGDYNAGCKLERGKNLKAQFGDGVLVGDTMHDIEIGKKMGLTTVWVSHGHQCYSLATKHQDVDFIYDRDLGKLERRR